MQIELSELWLIDPIHQPEADWLDDEKEALEVGKDYIVTVDGVRYVVPGRKYDKGDTEGKLTSGALMGLFMAISSGDSWN